MNRHFKQSLLSPLLVLGVSLVLAAPAFAQSAGASASLQVKFGLTPHWTTIVGTHVDELPVGERQDYDMFRYGGTYYVYNNNRWYTSTSDRGAFTAVDDRTVPTEFSTIPRDHWRNYPQGWEGRADQPTPGVSATMHVNVGDMPHWASIQGSRIEELPAAERPNYDLFRIDGTYYVYNNDKWYMSSVGTGDYTAMDDRSVPSEFAAIPREHWRNYPAGWRDGHDQGSDAMSASLQVDIGNAPRWAGVHGTRVKEVRGGNRPAYDLFRYDGNYYAYSNARWYTSNRGSGAFAVIDANTVPTELSKIPRSHWRNYPPSWVNANGTDRADRGGRAD